MKKFTKVLICCLIVVLALSLVACSTSGTLGKDEQGRYKLMVPELTISNNLVSWKAVRYCVGYEAKINDGTNEEVVTFASNRTSYPLASDKAVSFCLRALGDDEKSVSSAYSDWVSNTTKTILATPDKPTVTEDGDNIVISWNAIPNATSYSIEQSQKIKGGVTAKYPSDKNSLVIEKSRFDTPDVYSFRVMALGGDSFLSSGYSKMTSYVESQPLATVEPRHNSSNITWDKPADIPSDIEIKFVILMDKYLGEGANDQKIEVHTASSSTTTYSNTSVSNAVNTYKEKWEEKNTGQTMPLAGGYRIFVQTICTNHSEVYIAQEPVLVKKAVGTGEQEKLEDIFYQKPGKVDNVKIDKNGTVMVEDEPKSAHLLTWECDNEKFNKFKLKFYSNDGVMLDTTATTEEGTDRQANLTSRFTGEHISQAGKVLNVSITVQMDFAEGILEGEETYLTVDGSEDKYNYCFVPNSLEQVTDEGKLKDYFKIKNLGDFRYMLDNSVDGGKYYLTDNIDGAKSSTNCNFYVGNGIFKGIFDGCGKVISNINLIINSETTDKTYVSLFKEIAEGAEFKNVTFNNVTITIEDENVSTVALLAVTNNGTIECVNIVSSKFETNCTTAGFVITNNKNINSCGLLSTNIVADATESSSAVNGAAIAINNEENAKIFNASIYQSEINGTTKFANVRMGGVATYNNGQITNSFVKNTLVKGTTSVNDDNVVNAVVGGIAAYNNGGSIAECYVNNTGNKTKTVEAGTSLAQGSHANMDSVAGGIVGIMDGGSIDSCYLSYARVTANKKASGLIGDKTDSAITISNCYVYRITLSATEERSMILASKDGVTATNVYCFIGDANPTNKNNVEVVTVSSDLINKDLGDKFVTYKTDYRETPILKNMIYSNYSTSNLKVFIVTLDENPVMLEPVSTDVGSKRLQIYTQEINGMTLVLPIFRTK